MVEEIELAIVLFSGRTLLFQPLRAEFFSNPAAELFRCCFKIMFD
jgi:hypothetical protein